MSDAMAGTAAAGEVELDIDELAERLVEEDLGLTILTDEELAALGEPSHPDGPVGWFATLSEPEQETARNAAFRSLVSRGLLRPSFDGAEGFDVHPTLGLLRTVRREAVGLTSIARTSVHGTDRALLHLVGPGIVLEELLDADGLHACTLRSPERAVLAMSARLDPNGLATEVETEPLGGLEPDAEVEAFAEDLLSRATVSTNVMTIRRSHPDVEYASGLAAAVMIVETDERLWAIAAEPAGADTADEAGDTRPAAPGVVVVELTQAELYHTLLRVLDPVSLPAEASPSGSSTPPPPPTPPASTDGAQG